MENKTRIENIRLVQKGNKIVVKEDVPNAELGSKEVLDTIETLNNAISKAQEQINKLEIDIPRLKESIELNTTMLKKFNHFKDWATEIQKSKIKSIIEEVNDKVKKEVEESYIQDPTLTEDQNKKQMFRLYLGKLSTQERIGKEICNSIMREEFYTKPKIDNPF